MTPAGQRTERLTFQTRGPDINDDPLGAWVVGFKRWGRALARTRGEVVLGQRVQGVQPIEVTIPRDHSARQITTAWRILWRGVAYNILAVAPTEDRSELNILAEANQSDA